MCDLLAPILPHTADEAYRALVGMTGELSKNTSVHVDFHTYGNFGDGANFTTYPGFGREPECELEIGFRGCVLTHVSGSPRYKHRPFS